MLPWHGPATARRASPGRRPLPTVAQFRPVDPRIDPDTGRVVKYEFLAGAPTTLDVHPATPPGWLDHTPTAVITEGVLKGDAVLTGLLRGNGVPDAELGVRRHRRPDRPAAPAAAGRCPPTAHQLVVSLIGVTGWHQHPDWAQIDLDRPRGADRFRRRRPQQLERLDPGGQAVAAPGRRRRDPRSAGHRRRRTRQPRPRGPSAWTTTSPASATTGR